MIEKIFSLEHISFSPEPSHFAIPTEYEVQCSA